MDHPENTSANLIRELRDALQSMLDEFVGPDLSGWDAGSSVAKAVLALGKPVITEQEPAIKANAADEFEAGFLAGFLATGEGLNSEYPPGVMEHGYKDALEEAKSQRQCSS